MPTFSDTATVIDPDTIPRRVVAFGVVDVDHAFELKAHKHAKGELVMTMRGALTCEAAGGLWIVPPLCAIWIPSNTLHSVKASQSIEGYSLLIQETACSALPKSCCAVSVTPLLRELVVRCASFPALYPEEGLAKNLIELLIDELAIAPVEKLHLPMPTDPRLRAMAEEIIASPASRHTADQWARSIATSERTLHRILRRETGLSFSQWRHQLHIVLALQSLAKGSSVKQVAAELGYESAGSFVAMFKKSLGSPPGRYMAARQGGRRR